MQKQIKTKRIFFTVCIFILFLFSNPGFSKHWEKLEVNPLMTRVEIQQIIDSASDGDHIIFKEGVYDFSGEEIVWTNENTGLFVITDKSLTITGEEKEDIIIIGPDSIDPTGPTAQGLCAFKIINLDATKDVTIMNLHIKNFLMGIGVSFFLASDPYFFLPNARNIVIENCVLSDIHRNAIAVVKNEGSVTISNNQIATERVGIYIKETVTAEITNNTIEGGSMGIYIFGALQGPLIEYNQLSNMTYFGIDIWGIWENGTPIEIKGATVSNNILTNMQFLGIIADGELSSNHKIKNNSVHLMGDEALAGILIDAKGNKISQNQITGSGFSGILLGSGYDSTYNNLVNQNSLVGFEAGEWGSHYYLDFTTYDNTIKGTWEPNVYYIDQDGNNVVKRVFPVPESTSSLGFGTLIKTKSSRKGKIEL